MTEAGVLFAEYAERMLALHREMEARIRVRGEQGEDVTLSCGRSNSVN